MRLVKAWLIINWFALTWRFGYSMVRGIVIGACDIAPFLGMDGRDKNVFFKKMYQSIIIYSNHLIINILRMMIDFVEYVECIILSFKIS